MNILWTFFQVCISLCVYVCELCVCSLACSYLVLFGSKLFESKLQTGNSLPNNLTLTKNKGILLQNHNTQRSNSHLIQYLYLVTQSIWKFLQLSLQYSFWIFKNTDPSKNQTLCTLVMLPKSLFSLNSPPSCFIFAFFSAFTVLSLLKSSDQLSHTHTHTHIHTYIYIHMMFIYMYIWCSHIYDVY